MKLIKVLFLFYALAAPGSDLRETDLSGRWKGYQNESWRPFSPETRAVSFRLQGNDSGTLCIKGADDFSVFINHDLRVMHSRAVAWRLDSLKTAYIFPITVSVFSTHGLVHLSTILVDQSGGVENRIRGNSFVDAITILAFALLGALIFLFFSNGAVLVEYFNIAKVFSFRSSDESALVQRITSFNNVFIYGFLSVLMAVNLQVLQSSQFMHDPTPGWDDIVIDTFKLSAVILVILLLKIILINLSAGIFRLTETAPNQFFNFVRLLLGCFVFSTVFQLLVFISGGEFMYRQGAITALLAIAFVVYLVTTFLRLNSKGGFTVFHLFSYICISEIFPALLLLNLFIQ